jgi:hypothetical protein
MDRCRHAIPGNRQALDGILAWDSYFHLAHEAQRAMFAVFDARRRGPNVQHRARAWRSGKHFHVQGGAALSRKPLRQGSIELSSIVAASTLCSTPLTMCEAVPGLLGCAGASGQPHLTVSVNTRDSRSDR